MIENYSNRSPKRRNNHWPIYFSFSIHISMSSCSVLHHVIWDSSLFLDPDHIKQKLVCREFYKVQAITFMITSSTGTCAFAKTCHWWTLVYTSSLTNMGILRLIPAPIWEGKNRQIINMVVDLVRFCTQ